MAEELGIFKLSKYYADLSLNCITLHNFNLDIKERYVKNLFYLDLSTPLSFSKIKKMRLRKSIFLILAFLASVIFLISKFPHIKKAQAAGSTYYVATNGNDSNPGTEAQPFLTVNKGVSVLTPGDTLYVKNGTYAEALEDVIPSGTSWSNAVTVAAYPGHSPELKPSGTARVLYFSGGDDSYIVIDGFVLNGENLSSDVVKITTGSNHIRIKNSEVKNGTNQGIIVTPTNSDYNEFINLNVHDNGTTSGAHGIYIRTANNLIENSNIYSNFYASVKFTNPAKNNTLRNNTLHDSGTTGVVLGIETTDANTYIYNNLIYGNALGFETTTSLDDYYIYNNTIYDNTTGFSVTFTAGDFGPAHDLYIYNNIFYNNSTAGIQLSDDAYTNIFIKNNIFYRSDDNIIDPGGVTTQEGNISRNPLFVDVDSSNYHLSSKSPAIDAGLTLTAVASDYDGITRPQGSAYDIGAYESEAAATPTPTPTLVAASPSVTVGGPFTPAVRVTEISGKPISITSTGIKTGQTVREVRPTFSGTAVSKSRIRITIESLESGKSFPGTTLADESGLWFWVSPPLSSGSYEATILSQDEQGNSGTTTVLFSIEEVEKETVPARITNLFELILDFLRKLFTPTSN